MSLELATVTPADFEARTGDGWTLHSPDGPVSLTLARVRRLGESGRAGGAFALTFRTPEGPALPQGVHTLESANGDRLEVFLTPLQPQGGVEIYEAVFA